MYVVLLSSVIGVKLEQYVEHLKDNILPSKYVVLSFPGYYALSDLDVKSAILACLSNDNNKDKVVIISGALALDDEELLDKIDMKAFVHVDSDIALALHLKSLKTDEQQVEMALAWNVKNSSNVSLKDLNDAIYESVRIHAPDIFLAHSALLSEAIKELLSNIAKVKLNLRNTYKMTMFPPPLNTKTDSCVGVSTVNSGN